MAVRRSFARRRANRSLPGQWAADQSGRDGSMAASSSCFAMRLASGGIARAE